MCMSCITLKGHGDDNQCFMHHQPVAHRTLRQVIFWIKLSVPLNTKFVLPVDQIMFSYHFPGFGPISAYFASRSCTGILPVPNEREFACRVGWIALATSSQAERSSDIWRPGG